jgi:hypothetical protein
MNENTFNKNLNIFFQMSSKWQFLFQFLIYSSYASYDFGNCLVNEGNEIDLNTCVL